MGKRQRKGTWGGRRAGSGRPRTLKDAMLLNVRMPRADVERLRTVARQKGLDLSTHVRRVLMRSLAAQRARSR